MAIHIAKMSTERKIECRNFCIRAIVDVDKLPSYKRLVRDCDIHKEGYSSMNHEALTFKESDPPRLLYKYLNMDSFVLTLMNGLQFSQPSSEWPDPYESRFYNAKYSERMRPFTPRFFACCMTSRDQTEAAWKTYTKEKGLASKGVRLKLRAEPLRKILNEYAQCHNSIVYEGAVTYSFPQYEIDYIHEQGSKINALWFANFELRNFLSLMLVKRPEFYNEEEIRFMIVPKHNINDTDKSIYIDLSDKWNDLLDSVVLSPDSTPSELECMKCICNKYNISCEVSISKLFNENEKIEIEDVDTQNTWLKDCIKEI